MVDVVVAIGVNGLELVVLVVAFSVDMAVIFKEKGINLLSSLELLGDLKPKPLDKSVETPLERISPKLPVLRNESAYVERAKDLSEFTRAELAYTLQI